MHSDSDFLLPGWMTKWQRTVQEIRQRLIVHSHTLVLGALHPPAMHTHPTCGAQTGECRRQEAQVSRQPLIGRRGRVTRRC